MLLMDYTLGINVTFTGIFIVFMMLVLLVVILSIFGSVSQLGAKMEAKKALKAQAKKEELAPSQEPAKVMEKSEGQINPEVIAVISAAVASMYATSGKKPVIKSVKRSSNTRPAWASAGLYNNTRAF